MEMTIELREYQIPHYERVKEILSQSHFYLDGTRTGKGKTYIACKLAEELGLKLLVICPLTVKENWRRVGEELDIVDIITYQSLRTTKGRQPTHGLLQRIDGNKIEFIPTDYLLDILDDGVLIIVDEYHHVKNKSIQNAAVRALISEVKETRSRVGMLSATPIDREELAINLLLTLGVMKNESISQLLSYINVIEPSSHNFWRMRSVFINKASDCKQLIYTVFINVIKKKVMSIMVEDEKSEYKLNVINAFHTVERKELIAYEDAVRDLNSAIVSFKTVGKEISNITLALREVQNAKVPLLVRLVKERMKRDCKVVVFARFHITMSILGEELREYNPLFLNGKVKEVDRIENIEKFQRNDGDYRLIICNPTVGGEGVSLHDTHGGWPREVISLADWSVDKQYQAIGRCFRDGVKSDVSAQILYINSSLDERSILLSFSNKGRVLNEVVTEQGGVFPNQYKNVYC